MTASVYIHIPFCDAKCDYCDFFSVSPDPQNREGLFDSYTEKLCEELNNSLGGLEAVPSVYIGGGTPSVLGPSRIKTLLDTLQRAAPGAGELTLEANPESVDEKFLAAARDGGVTRLSLGIQSFDEKLRRLIGRRGGNPERALALAAEAFGAGLCLDLMTGLPGQDTESLSADIKKALALRGGHISLYSLTLEDGVPLKSRLETEFPDLDRDEGDVLWIAGRDALEASGYGQYEVSNFSLPGRESLHNARYWRMENWLGFGPGASGTVFFDRPSAAPALRKTVPGDIGAYINGGLVPEEEYIDSLTLLKETLLMGFRTLSGPDEGLFERRFGLSIAGVIPQSLEKWRRMDLAGPRRSALTRTGLLFLNRFLADVFAELEEGDCMRPEMNLPRTRFAEEAERQT
jgi:oxygen-independent coproporphyrinogen-3 oxidase